ncbi:alpha/beta fold hydrolase [Marinomonas mediterranea]|uniref:Carboxylesterase n=1 Tax=Marinomonas mediterranea (strain ATCC 700492 / JCM 21426 / NBRC 103028 / MMB-1) TaxID=717774 RepID=F2K3M6_MARM1|nr:alpha/beta fold hydrolase [Marinomonas mediterranea]ADZ92465.1 Carboxylesterase [Marinomonas mediterranea MMB-1]WCN10414.1 alpha/beta fold hydrolase [Marinomonas mediterranea]WCN14460.1 alpha/beta fold hydrolase [Marinomonas mediterranea]WCN18512.1 alpha/beta fold hydrolase [Marinomonas mediterranea MMB-1]
MRTPIETQSFGNSENLAVFIVSGWAMPKEIFNEFAERLSERFYVVVASLPGVTCSEEWRRKNRIGPNYDVDALTEQLIRVAPSNAWWLGWSLGGMVSTYVAARRSSCVQGLITLASAPSFVEREGWSCGMPLKEFDLFQSLVQKDAKKGLKRFVSLQASGAKDERALTKAIRSIQNEELIDEAALTGGLYLLKSLDVRRELALLDLPNAHFYGKQDALVNFASLGAQLPHNELQTVEFIDDSAHQPFMECSELFLERVTAFIDANRIR